jgi:hypothetical protein
VASLKSHPADPATRQMVETEVVGTLRPPSLCVQ